MDVKSRAGDAARVAPGLATRGRAAAFPALSLDLTSRCFFHLESGGPEKGEPHAVRTHKTRLSLCPSSSRARQLLRVSFPKHLVRMPAADGHAESALFLEKCLVLCPSLLCLVPGSVSGMCSPGALPLADLVGLMGSPSPTPGLLEPPSCEAGTPEGAAFPQRSHLPSVVTGSLVLPGGTAWSRN